jgi:hypothetical protein
MRSLSSIFSRLATLRRSSAFREMIAYAFQTYGITVINIVSAFILVRLFSKDVYASYGIIFSIVGVLNVFLNGGMARLISFQILKAPLTDEERTAVMGFFRWGYLLLSVLFVCCLPEIYHLYGLNISIFTTIAFFIQQFYDIVNLIYIPQVREHALRRYVVILSIFDYSRAIFPILGVIFIHDLRGYFIGLIISAAACLVALIVYPFWRKKIGCYVRFIFQPLKRIGAYADRFKLGYGIAFESGASALYLSVLILAASKVLRGPDLADLKVAIGYTATLGFVVLPFTRWVTFHLPSRLERSTRPFSLLMKTSVMGFVLGCCIVAGSILFGRWLLPFAYGAKYATAVLYIAPASLNLLFTNGLIPMSVYTRKYALSWKSAQISMASIFVGLLYMLSPIGPRTAFGYALFYGFWVLPSSILMISITYRRLNHVIVGSR